MTHEYRVIGTDLIPDSSRSDPPSEKVAAVVQSGHDPQKVIAGGRSAFEHPGER